MERSMELSMELSIEIRGNEFDKINGVSKKTKRGTLRERSQEALRRIKEN